MTGRFVQSDGQPRDDVGFQLYYLGFDLLDDYIFVRTSAPGETQEGRFRLVDIVPGLRIRIYPTNGRGIDFDHPLTFPPLKPGETRDLGDIVIGPSGKAE